jgi:hypothetical protein
MTFEEIENGQSSSTLFFNPEVDKTNQDLDLPMSGPNHSYRLLNY